MAAIDNGTIIYKNGKMLDLPDPNLDESDEIVNGIFFHRDLIMEKRAHFRQVYDHDYENHPEDLYMNLWDD